MWSQETASPTKVALTTSRSQSHIWTALSLSKATRAMISDSIATARIPQVAKIHGATTTAIQQSDIMMLWACGCYWVCTLSLALPRFCTLSLVLKSGERLFESDSARVRLRRARGAPCWIKPCCQAQNPKLQHSHNVDLSRKELCRAALCQISD